MATSTSRSCELCGGDRFEVIGQRDRHGDRLETVVCRGCGLVSHAEIPTDDELAQYYAREYRRDYNGEESPSAKRVVREWRRAETRFQIAQPFLRADDRVFEIGAGIGCNLKQFELAGHDASGIEPGEGFCRYSREQLHCRVQPGYWNELTPLPRYDFVLLIHVLEHFNSPLGALQRMRQILRPGGRLIIEVPNLASPHAAPGRQFHYAHIYNFTPWTLAAIGQAAGFRVKHVAASPRDNNLTMILARAATPEFSPPPDGYERTIAALRRYNGLTYYLRPSYWIRRLRTVASALHEHATAPRRMQAILQRCASLSERTSRAA